MKTEMSKKNLVVYHRADFDGLFCREIARKFLGDTAEYIGWDYGDPFVKMPDEGPVYILDLSPECLDARDTAPPFWNRIIWIDHHKSAIEKFSPEKYPIMAGYRIDGVAACRLAWAWFASSAHDTENHPHQGLPEKQQFVDRLISEPLAVRLVGEYDIWDKRDARAELFQHGLRSQALTEIDWAILLEERSAMNLFVNALLDKGRSLQYAQTQQNESIIKDIGFDIQFEGLKFLACNHARYNSFLFTAGLTPEHDGCFGFKFDGKKKEWSISLYHAPGKEHHDLSLIATKHGGGGHRGACGFRLRKLPF